MNGPVGITTTSGSKIYRLRDGFSFDGFEIAMWVERYPFRPSPGFHRFQFADILFDPTEGQAMEAEVRIDGSKAAATTIIGMATGGEITEAHKRSMNLGFYGRHATLVIRAIFNDQFELLADETDDLIVDEFGDEIGGVTGVNPGFRLNGVNWGWQAQQRVSR